MNSDLKKVKRQIAKLGPTLSKTDDAFKAAVILLLGLSHGHNCITLSKASGYDLVFIKGIASNLKQSRVWRKHKTYCNWFDATNGGIEFWLDVSVSLGLLQRAN